MNHTGGGMGGGGGGMGGGGGGMGGFFQKQQGQSQRRVH